MMICSHDRENSGLGFLPVLPISDYSESEVSNKQPGRLFFCPISESGTVIRFWYFY